MQRLDLALVLLGDRLALELHRRRQLVAARHPVAGHEIVNLLICSTRASCSFAASTASWTAARTRVVAGQLGERGRPRSVLRSPTRARSRDRGRSSAVL